MAGAILPTQRWPTEVPLSIQFNTHFKFHILIECGEWRVSTLGHEALEFVSNTQRILDKDGWDFQHPLVRIIWESVLKCTKLGDGEVSPVIVPFDDEAMTFDWKRPNLPRRRANLWIRVFEIGSAKLADKATIKANIDAARSASEYWKGVQAAVHSDPSVLEASQDFWKQTVGFVDREAAAASERYIGGFKAWMRPAPVDWPHNKMFHSSE